MTPRTAQPAGTAHPAPQGTWSGTTAAAAAARYEAAVVVAPLANGLGSAAESAAAFAADSRGGAG